MAESAVHENQRAKKRLKMVNFNARVARNKHAQCDLSLKGMCSKYEHEADHKRRLHMKEVNQLKYDFRIMQVDLKRQEMLAKKARDPDSDVSEEEQFILKSTKYLANDQAGAFYLSKKNPFPMRHFSNPAHISVTVQQARQALAKHMAEHACEDQHIRHTHSAGSHRLSATLSVASTTSGTSGTSSTSSSEGKPRPQTSVCTQLWRRQVHFEHEQKATDSTETDNREHRKKTGKTLIPKPLDDALSLQRRPHTSPFHTRNTSTPIRRKISDWVADVPAAHPAIRRTQSFQPHTDTEFSRVKRVRSQSISYSEGRIMREVRMEKDAADEKVKVFLSTLKEEGLAAKLHMPKPVTYYRHVTVPGPKDYWRRLGEKVLHEREEERRKSHPHPTAVHHPMLMEDRAKKHSVATKLSNVVKNIMKMKRTCEILEYEKLKQEMAQPKQMAELQTQTDITQT